MKEQIQYVAGRLQDATGISEYKRAKKYMTDYYNDENFAITSASGINGALGFLFPNALKKIHIYEVNGANLSKSDRKKALLTIASDSASCFVPAMMAGSGLIWEAGVVKIGYNTLSQIAPDFYHLAKSKLTKNSKQASNP